MALNLKGNLSVFRKRLGFDPSSIKDDDGNLLLSQQVLTKQSPTIAGVITDERKNKGDARAIQQGRAYLFDGTDDFVTYASGISLFNDSTNPFTVRFKIKPTSVTGIRKYVAQQSGSTPFKGVAVYSNGTSLAIGIINTVTTNEINAIATGVVMVAGNEYDIQVSYDGSKSASGVTWTVNGVVTGTTSTVDSLTSSDIASGTALNLGRDSVGSYASTLMHGVEIIDDTTGQHAIFYKCDEQAGTIAYDSSGNARNGTITNATLSTFHSTQDVYSFQNEVGYSKPSTVFIPRNEAIPTQDVTGATLEFTGQVPYNAKAEQSNCIALNGTTQYISIADNTDLNITNNLSVVIRAKNDFSSLATQEGLIGKYTLTGNKREWYLFVDTANKISVAFGNPSDGTFLGTYSATNAVTIENTKFYGFTFNSGTVKLFVDGLEVAGSVTSGSIPSTLYNSDSVLTLGAVATSDYWDGQLYDARIYDTTVLTSAQMLAINNGTESITGARLVAHYPIAEGSGQTIYDVSGNGNHASLINAPTWAKQDVYHYNLVSGFSKYMNFDGVDDAVQIANSNDINFGTGDFAIEFKLYKISPPSVLMDILNKGKGGSGGRRYQIFLNTNGTVNLQIDDNTTLKDATSTTNVCDGVLHTIKGIKSGNNIQIEIDGVVEATTNVTGYTSIDDTAEPLLIGKPGTGMGASINLSGAIVFDFSFTKAGTVTASYNGYGNASTNWTDQTGSNNGTVLGSPLNILIPAQTPVLDVFEQTLRSPAGAYHNGAETLIDFTNNVLSPQAVINSWETAWAFNTARVNPEFKRTLTQDSVDHRADRFLAYREALSGANLTKVQKYTEDKAL